MKSIDRVRSFAFPIFKNQELVERYLDRPNRRLQGKTPREVAKNERGAYWVIEILSDDAYGVIDLPKGPAR